MGRTTHLIEADTLGECWLAVSRLVMAEGYPARYDDAPIKEVANLTTVVQHPDPDDEIIRRHGDAGWLEWMHENFFTQKEVEELDNAASYAIRLFNYADEGRDQIQWVIDRLKGHAEARSATITTFMPLTDTSYIPCISMLDFWVPEGKLELVVYAHSLDFGKKAYGNLVELAALQRIVADGVGVPIGPQIIHVKTAHIYEPEFDYMRGLVATSDPVGEAAQ